METTIHLLSCTILLMLAFSDEQSLLIKVHDVGVNSLKLSWEYGGSWSWARVKCLGEKTPHTPNNCSTDILPKSSYKPTTVYGLVPTYSYRFEIELMQLDPNEITISNTTDLIVMGVSPIIVSEIEVLEKEQIIRVLYSFDPAGLWYDDIEMIVESQSPSAKKTSQRKQVNELCSNPECKGAPAFHFQLEPIPGLSYIFTVVSSKFVSNALRQSYSIITNKTLAPKHVRQLEAKATKMPRQVALTWVWPDQGVLTAYVIGCESSIPNDTACRYERFPFNHLTLATVKPKNIKHLIDDLHGGATYKFFVALETAGVLYKQKESSGIIVAPDSVTDLYYEIIDGVVMLRWRWPLKSVWTHYSVKCSTYGYEELDCLKALFPVASSEVKQAAEYEHIVNIRYLDRVYKFEVNVEWFGIPALYPANVEIGSRAFGKRRTLTIMAILLLIFTLLTITFLVINVVKRKGNPVWQWLEEIKSSKKRRSRTIPVSGSQAGICPPHNHSDECSQQCGNCTEVQRSIKAQEGSTLKEEYQETDKMASRERSTLPEYKPALTNYNEKEAYKYIYATISKPRK